ncbi:MAG: hypothetical protein NUV77_11810 [Thermoguttaceae bacterium]|nr:hypothetical protein [Thermoguttaceae bacterium]
MSLPGREVQYRQYRAPREDRAALVDPPLDTAAELVEANRRGLAGCDVEIGGQPLAELARRARRELIAEARRWTARYREVAPEPADPAAPLFLAGHQPQLFHPGVWLKNFALGWLAERHGGTAINLVVDSDTMKTHLVPVPSGSVLHPQVSFVPLDQPGEVVPFEERRVVDGATFRDFGRKAAEAVTPLVPNPLVREFWSLATARLAQTDNLGQCLAESRHQWEQGWGLATLEVPQSRVCQLPSFARFAAYLLAEAPRFVPVYNEAVREYRELHGIRSTAHPVPDLVVDGSWHEAPFWVWTADDPRRRRLFVRARRDGLVLADRGGWEQTLSLRGGDFDRVIEQWVALGRRVKIRSRALVTTLWARIALGDLFLHGIGGAKYDQVTDAVMARFFGMRPPAILVLSATLQLPIARRRVTPDHARAIDRRLRDLVWHPERCLAGMTPDQGHGEVEVLIAAKRRWIETSQTPQNARMRWREIRRINEALQPWLADERQRLLACREQLALALRAEKILGSREHSFCLYPAETLRGFFREVLGPARP